MNEIIIRGGRPLEGSVRVQGAKNSVLPILAATILHPGQVTLRGCPHLSDVEASIRILRHLGCQVRWEGDELLVDSSSISRHLPGGDSGPAGLGGDELPRRLRAGSPPH